MCFAFYLMCYLLVFFFFLDVTLLKIRKDFKRSPSPGMFNCPKAFLTHLLVHGRYC